MKKILFITALLIGFLGSAQDSIVKAVSLKGRGPFLVKGSITGTTITGAQIVDSLNLELGSTDWQDGATTSASDLTSGVLADGRVQESNVTQHEGALTIGQSQVTGLGTALNGKEDLLNKVTDLSTPDNTQYPTTLAVSNELADRPTSLGTGRTNPVEYSDIYGQTLSDYNTDGAGSAGDLIIITDASPAEVVATATIAMDGWKMYDDQTADAATITLSDCDPGETLTVYINRASAPTLAGTGLTFNQLPNTTAFASATEMMIIFEVAYDGTTIDYYYVER